LKDPLTAEPERNLQELESWYKNDMEVKKAIEELKTTFRQDARDIKDRLGEVHQSIDRLSSSAAGSQSGGGM